VLKRHEIDTTGLRAIDPEEVRLPVILALDHFGLCLRVFHLSRVAVASDGNGDEAEIGGYHGLAPE
jgi:hypothetical protein